MTNPSSKENDQATERGRNRRWIKCNFKRVTQGDAIATLELLKILSESLSN